jgi:hypothetical protein
MAKGQLRSNKEAKKPKQPKTAVPGTPSAATPFKPAARPPGKKK